MAERLNLQQFGATIKKKYPQYSDLDDADLGKRMLAKYPQYKDMVIEESDGKLDEPFVTPQEYPTEQPKGPNPMGVRDTVAVDLLKGTAKAFEKGGLNLVKGLGGIGKFAFDKILGKSDEQRRKESQDFDNTKASILESPVFKTKMVPQGAADAIGEIITYIAPFTKVGKAAEAASAITQSPKLAAIIKAGVEALGGAGIAGATSDDGTRMDNAVKTGAISGGLSLLGSIVTPFIDKTAHKLYNQTYKKTIQEAEKAFGNEDPTVVADVAQWAMDKGIKGSLKTQSKQVAKILDDSEKAIIETAKSITQPVKVPDQVLKLADDLRIEFGDYGQGEVADDIARFIASVKDGTAPVEQVIYFRRLLDSLRTKSSFRNAKIGDNVSYWADNLRNVINNIDELGTINKDYALAIRAKDALIAAAKNGANRRFVNLWTDLVPALAFFGIGGAPGMIAGVSGIKAAQSPAVQTIGAQGLKALEKVGPEAKALLQAVGKSQTEKVSRPPE